MKDDEKKDRQTIKIHNLIIWWPIEPQNYVGGKFK